MVSKSSVDLGVKGNYKILGQKAIEIALKGGKFQEGAFSKYGIDTKEALRNLASAIFEVLNENSDKYSASDVSTIKSYINQVWNYSKGGGVSSKAVSVNNELVSSAKEATKEIQKETESITDFISKLNKLYEEQDKVRAQREAEKQAQLDEERRNASVKKRYEEFQASIEEGYKKFKEQLEQNKKAEQSETESTIQMQQAWEEAGIALSNMFGTVKQNKTELELFDEYINKLISSDDKFNKVIGHTLKYTTDLISKNRKLSITQSLFDGIRGAFGKMIGYTKIMSSSIGLVKSSFGFIIDMIFLPLLPLVLAIAEGFFMVGDAIGNTLEWIGSINPLFAQLISLGGLLAIAFGMFLTGKLLTDLLGVKNILSAIVNLLGDEKLATATKTTTSTAETATTSSILSRLGGVITLAEFVIGGVAGWFAGMSIVKIMEDLGISQALSTIGEVLNIHNVAHSGAGYNIFESGVPDALKFLKNLPGGQVLDVADKIHFMGEFINSSIDVWNSLLPDWSISAKPLTATGIEKTLQEGRYSSELQSVLDTKFGKDTFMFLDAGNPFGLDEGYYLVINGQPIGGAQKSMSSMVSSTSNVNYTTNYQNTNGNGAFNLFNVAGL